MGRPVCGRSLIFLMILVLAGCAQIDFPTPLPAIETVTVAKGANLSPTNITTDTPTSTASPTVSPTPTISPSPSSTPVPAPTSGPTPDGIYRNLSVPILMYHYISVPPEGSHQYRVGNSLPPETFIEHLDYLQAEGYTTIYLKDLISYLATGVPELPEKPIILTFDDGYEDVYLNAFPALLERDRVATFFIITDFATEAAENDAYELYADWKQLAEMAAAGMEIGSHSRNHPNLAGKDLDYLVWQALGSQENIEANIGYHPHILSYPAGSYDAFVIDVFRSAHFWGAVTTKQGVDQDSDHIFELKRIRISQGTGVPQLHALLNYDWPE